MKRTYSSGLQSSNTKEQFTSNYGFINIFHRNASNTVIRVGPVRLMRKRILRADLIAAGRVLQMCGTEGIFFIVFLHKNITLRLRNIIIKPCGYWPE